ncbi:MAG: hypothetical protein FWC77_01690 [Defluviitaleaceae bacterium]|nr:hypothetical protein [Defluviitaleaceae bacterium]
MTTHEKVNGLIRFHKMMSCQHDACRHCGNCPSVSATIAVSAKEIEEYAETDFVLDNMALNRALNEAVDNAILFGTNSKP